MRRKDLKTPAPPLNIFDEKKETSKATPSAPVGPR